jgi:uncharacterized protein (TIGR02391 family)
MIKLLLYMPDPEALLKLEPEELAGYVMEYFNSLPPSEKINRFSLGQPFHHSRERPPSYQVLSEANKEKIRRALIEAWFWLEREGFLAQELGDPNRDDYFVTRKGRRVKNALDLGAMRKIDLLPKSLLHPIIAEKTWSLFLRGEYDTGIFQAFKEVEVAVRAAGKYDNTDYGVKLMRKAFHPTNGPLSDLTNPDEGERQAMSDLFAGAIGSCKNPASHRQWVVTAEETAEMIMLASHLLRIVDSRTSTSP